MSGLAALLAGRHRPDVYLWHSAAHVRDVEHAVEKAGWRFVYLDGWPVEDKPGFLKAIAAAFAIADDLGDSIDALTASLAGVTAGDQHGVVLLWDGWGPLARADEQAFSAALGVLTGRVHAGPGGKFAVVLRGDGPSVELPELEAKTG